MTALTGIILFLIGAPLLGGLLTGIDRVITARMQSRKGPPVLQPFYDLFKLWEKSGTVVNNYQHFYILCFLVFSVLAGCIFFAGGDLLLSIFAYTVGGVFLALGAFSTSSPYSNVGASRELLQMLAYEPMLIITAMGLYLIAGSFDVGAILQAERSALLYLPGIFLGFLFILTIKLRKSPFDLSTSHHGHQEIVKGLTTDFSGRGLAIIELAHWYEEVLILGIVYLFFAPLGIVPAVLLTLVTYFLEVLVDNTNARLKWQTTVKSSWWVAGTLGLANLIVVDLVLK